MERLTHKVDGEYYPIQNILGSVRPRIHAKLGKLEDIEEELGIPLEVLFKALKDGIYIYDYVNNIILLYNAYLEFDNEKQEWYIDGVKLKDYGKTWALVREELNG